MSNEEEIKQIMLDKFNDIIDEKAPKQESGSPERRLALAIGTHIIVHSPPEILKLLAKQRTQLLARVREEVIGEETHQYCDNFNHDRSCQKEIGSDLLKREQLKKLEIISEEGK